MSNSLKLNRFNTTHHTIYYTCAFLLLILSSSPRLAGSSIHSVQICFKLTSSCVPDLILILFVQHCQSVMLTGLQAVIIERKFSNECCCHSEESCRCAGKTLFGSIFSTNDQDILVMPGYSFPEKRCPTYSRVYATEDFTPQPICRPFEVRATSCLFVLHMNKNSASPPPTLT
jgi:hypothetical protein